MSTIEALSRLTNGLESQIKSALRGVVESDSDFEIAADYNTHLIIDGALKFLGLSVHGMHVSIDEFAIFFEFGDYYRQIDSKIKPYQCRIVLQNDGNYSFPLLDSHFACDWELSILDSSGTYFYSLIKSGALNEDDVEEMNKVLFLKILST